MANKCELCKHQIVKYSQIYKGLVETCEFDMREKGCEEQYERKENENAKRRK